MRRTLKKLAGATGGLTLIVVGVPVIIMPIPLGLPMIALGVFLLLQTSSRARLLRRRLARRYPETAQRFEVARRELLQLAARIRSSHSSRGNQEP